MCSRLWCSQTSTQLVETCCCPILFRNVGNGYFTPVKDIPRGTYCLGRPTLPGPECVSLVTGLQAMLIKNDSYLHSHSHTGVPNSKPLQSSATRIENGSSPPRTPLTPQLAQAPHVFSFIFYVTGCLNQNTDLHILHKFTYYVQASLTL